MKRLLKSILFSVLDGFAPALGQRGVILMYHSVSDNGAFFTVRPDQFERQMRHLKAAGCRVVPLSALVTTLNSGADISGMVALTFDDGYRDNLTHAFPILQRYEMPATIFMATAYIGATMTNSAGLTLPMLSVDDIHKLSESSLIDFMPHTHTHPRLDRLMPDAVRDEIDTSRRHLESLLGGQANILAYPQGRYSPAIVKTLQADGWRGAVTVRTGLVYPNSNRYELPRNSIDSATSFSEFRGKLSGAIEWYRRIRRHGS